ncbi:MAG: uroporphyrinogen-III synthase [Pseudomonadota bacterium]
MNALDGVRVLVTRPAQQSDNLCRMIEAQGGIAVRLPLLAIQPTAHPARAQSVLEAARTHDAWIFTSANAVRHAEPLCRPPWPPRVAAVGAATAAALEAGGHEVQMAPLSAHSAEALLALPELADVRGRRLLIVTGEDGLDVLPRALFERGAQVEVAEVYRRVPLPYDAEAVLSALRGVEVIVISSGQALVHLLNLTPEGSRATLFKKQLTVPSARVLEQARALGFVHDARVTQPMSDAAIVRALVEWRTHD